MKNFQLIRVALVIALIFFGTPSPVMAEDTIELRMASWGPLKHYAAESRAEWIAAVEARSNGQLDIIEYPGGQLYGPKDMHKAVAKGLIDIGVILQPRLMATVPLLQGVYLPFAFDDQMQAARAYEGESLAIIEKAMEARYIKLLFPSFVGGVQIYSHQANISHMNDFTRMRILATSPMMTEILHRLGAAPDTSIPQTEQYMALKRGVADAVTNSIVGGYFQKSFEVAPHLTILEMSFPTILTTMNLQTWQSLPPALQSIMLEEGQKQMRNTLAMTAAWEAKFRQAIASNGGIVTDIPEPVRNQIKQVSAGVWRDWAQENGADAQRLLELNIPAIDSLTIQEGQP